MVIIVGKHLIRKRDFSGVLMQQGRVQLDADWNELVGIISRRMRAETTDIIGRGTVPTETPDGFKIAIAADGTLTIGRGRIYVDGLLAENHGKTPLEFDPVLAETRGTLPMPFNEQPYFPNVANIAPAPTQGGPHLVYLDVWPREVTYLENPDLLEKAVGVDTATRLQTVWQMRVLENAGAGITCATPDDQIPGWPDIVRPSDGRLSTDAVGVAATDDPCVIPPSGGYRGLENRLYRVEIHDGGVAGTATFKWSRDNASIMTSVTAIPALDKLIVARVCARQHAALQHWRLDRNYRRLAGIRAIARPDLPDQGRGRCHAYHHADESAASGHIRGRRAGQHRSTTSHAHQALEPAGQGHGHEWKFARGFEHVRQQRCDSVPASGTSTVLEDGVQITFDTPNAGIYRVGDFWYFAARTADASVEELVRAPRWVFIITVRLAVVTSESAERLSQFVASGFRR